MSAKNVDEHSDGYLDACMLHIGEYCKRNSRVCRKITVKRMILCWNIANNAKNEILSIMIQLSGPIDREHQGRWNVTQ